MIHKKEYFKNGNLKEEWWEHENGKRWKTILYFETDNGVKFSQTIKLKNGWNRITEYAKDNNNRAYRRYYKNERGEFVGKLVSWYRNGKVLSRDFHKYGMSHGKYIFYNKDGSINHEWWCIRLRKIKDCKYFIKEWTEEENYKKYCKNCLSAEQKYCPFLLEKILRNEINSTAFS